MDSSTVSSYRLKVSIGNDHFCGQGPQDVVREDYERFLARAGKSGPTEDAAGSDPAANGNGHKQSEDRNPIEAAWDRAYKRKDNSISLHVLPQGKSANADAIVLLLYGYQTLLGQESVKTTDLMEAAKVSGLRIDRIERRLPASHKALIIRGGNGKGTRYSLNNRGLAQAQSLLDRMFE